MGLREHPGRDGPGLEHARGIFARLSRPRFRGRAFVGAARSSGRSSAAAELVGLARVGSRTGAAAGGNVLLLRLFGRALAVALPGRIGALSWRPGGVALDLAGLALP